MVLDNWWTCWVPIVTVVHDDFDASIKEEVKAFDKHFIVIYLLTSRIWIFKKKRYSMQIRNLQKYHYVIIGRCPWCNSYRPRIWTRRYEFNSWTRLIAFHIALISLGKVWIQLFSLQLWVNSRTDWVLPPWWGN